MTEADRERELFEANVELRKLTVKRKVEPEERRFSDSFRVVLKRRTMPEIQSSKGEAGLAGTAERRCPDALGVGLNQRASLGDQSSVSSAGGAQKKRKAVVRRVSADTQECESCQQNDVDVDKEELSFVPSSVGTSAGWRTP